MWELEKQAPLPVLIYFGLTGSFKSVWTFKTEVTHHREHSLGLVSHSRGPGSCSSCGPSLCVVLAPAQVLFCFVFFSPHVSCKYEHFSESLCYTLSNASIPSSANILKKNTRSCRNVGRDVSPRLTDGDLLLGFTSFQHESAVFISSFCKDMTMFTDMTLLHFSHLLKTRSKAVSLWSTGEKIQHVQLLERQNPTHDHFQILCLALAFQSFSSAQRLMQNPQSSVTFLCAYSRPPQLKGKLAVAVCAS